MAQPKEGKMAEKKQQTKAVTKADHETTINAVIEQKKTLRDRLLELRTQEEAANRDIGPLMKVAEDATEQRILFEKSIPAAEKGREKWEHEQLEMLQRVEQAALEAVQQAKQRSLDIGNCKNAVQTEILTLPVHATLAEALQYQEAVAKTWQKVTDLRAGIAKQQEIIVAATPKPLPIPELKRRLEDLQADQALGHVTPGEVEAAAKELAAVEVEAASAEEQSKEITARVQGAISGLSRKLADAEAEYAMLQANRNIFAAGLLRTEAEELGLEYSALAEKISQVFRRLRSLETMQMEILGHQSEERFFAISGDLKIPAFNLAACGCHHRHGERDLVNEKEFRPWDHHRGHVVDEVERLRALGVTIL